ncbi:hypothetical protein Tco_1381082, partial [Tanacetum coccineum]
MLIVDTESFFYLGDIISRMRDIQKTSTNTTNTSTSTSDLNLQRVLVLVDCGRQYDGSVVRPFTFRDTRTNAPLTISNNIISCGLRKLSTTDDVVTDHKRRISSRVPEGKRPYYGPVALPPAINKNKNTLKSKITSTKTSTNVVSTTDNTTIISQQQQQPSTSTSISSISARFLYVPHSADDIAK